MIQMECNACIVGVKDIKTKAGKEMRMLHILHTDADTTMYGQRTSIAWAFEGSSLFKDNPHDLVDHACVVADVSGKTAIVAVEYQE